MEITKSSRHSKINGNYGENLTCSCLSKTGFEVSIIDHTGIDIIAYNPKTNQRMGISVKSRTRQKGKETESVNILSKNKKDRQKVYNACKAFGCEPWIAVYVESVESANLFLLSLEHYDECYGGNTNQTVDTWKMSEKYLKLYKEDPKVKSIHMDFSYSSWEFDN